MDESLESKVKHLRTVEGLSIRQIAQALRIGKKRVNRIIKEQKVQKPLRKSILTPYDRLIDQWYKEHPYLRAQQVYERLRSYGYSGSYVMVVIYTRKYRTKRKMPVVDRKIELTPDRHLKLTPLKPIISFLKTRKEGIKRGVKHVQVATGKSIKDKGVFNQADNDTTKNIEEYGQEISTQLRASTIQSP
jgi:hypothetical protein